MIKILASALLILFVSCSPKKEVENTVYYIISHPDTLKQGPANNAPPPPPIPFYSQHNFILYDSSRVFYHNNYVFYRCGMGIDFSRPPRLFLAADSLTEIKLSELPAFLKTTINESREDGDRMFTNIASPTDTIRNPAFKIITTYFKTAGIKAYGIRRWTEEEEFATKAKVKHTEYNPKTAEFKTGFDHPEIPPIDSASNHL
jgi:hypothetical protein